METVLEGERLVVRPFVMDDLNAIHTVMTDGFGGGMPLEERRDWLSWTILGYTVQARLYQPPYGERAVVLKSTGELIGAVGLVQSYGPFSKLPFFGGQEGGFTPEMGLFWVIAPAMQGQGYATEAAQILIKFMFKEWNLARIIATTEYDNAASIGVMRRLGMTIERNPDPTPEWFQVVGILQA
ncbi:MAG: GNAT family N-acetyltransferase [Anaerolineae bacterium]